MSRSEKISEGHDNPFSSLEVESAESSKALNSSYTNPAIHLSTTFTSSGSVTIDATVVLMSMNGDITLSGTGTIGGTGSLLFSSLC